MLLTDPKFHSLLTLSSNNSRSKTPRPHKLHIFGIFRTSAFTWWYPGYDRVQGKPVLKIIICLTHFDSLTPPSIILDCKAMDLSFLVVLKKINIYFDPAKRQIFALGKSHNLILESCLREGPQ